MPGINWHAQKSDNLCLWIAYGAKNEVLMIDHLKTHNRKTHRTEIDPSSMDDIRRTLDERGWHVTELPRLGDNVFEARPPESLLCYVYLPDGDTESPPIAVLAGGWSPPDVCDIAEGTARLLKN